MKACTRDAEAADRPALVTQAAAAELRQLRPTFVAAARSALSASEGALFPTEVFQPAPAPTTAIEHAVLRECGALATARLAADQAIALAVTRALGDRVNAAAREVRAQVSLESPRDCAEFMSRFGEATRAADLPETVRRHLEGRVMQQPPRLRLDLDSDLRGRP